MIPLYNHKLYNDIWEDAAAFVADYNTYEAAINNLNNIGDLYSALTWQLIASKYGNTPIRSNSVSQFKMSVFGIMFSEAPTFVKKLENQKKIRDLTEAQLEAGETSISNSAANPDEEPTTSTLDELKYVNHQNTVKQKRSKIQAIAMQTALLEEDLSESYVRKFASLFARVYVPADYIYPTEEDED